MYTVALILQWHGLWVWHSAWHGCAVHDYLDKCSASPSRCEWDSSAAAMTADSLVSGPLADGGCAVPLLWCRVWRHPGALSRTDPAAPAGSSTVANMHQQRRAATAVASQQAMQARQGPDGRPRASIAQQAADEHFSAQVGRRPLCVRRLQAGALRVSQPGCLDAASAPGPALTSENSGCCSCSEAPMMHPHA